MNVAWPDRKAFAFSVMDDTDFMTLRQGERIYGFIQDLGLRTTKSVWPLAGNGTPIAGGATCGDPEYAAWVQSLVRIGFEIALHNATYHSSKREHTIEGIRRFKDLTDHPPRVYATHAHSKEELYWGEKRVSGLNRTI